MAEPVSLADDSQLAELRRKLVNKPRWLDMTPEQRAAASKERNKIRCSKCPNWWTGLRACHCAACHQTFSGISAFDKHRDGSHVKGTRCCVDPAEVGLVLVQKNGWLCWSQPGTYDGPYDNEDE